MQKERNNSEVVSLTSESKSAWYCPTLSRIDIKRTMTGSAGAIDSQAGIIPS